MITDRVSAIETSLVESDDRDNPSQLLEAKTTCDIQKTVIEPMLGAKLRLGGQTRYLSIATSYPNRPKET
jgi:hypothetical protein